eukprot:Pompholyxophrys_punicea_v1_NODE_200_length_2805_cov_13.133406.p2 type:complete len:201 gc:universal NODE_200_length_2805_cov_13.133406:2700-2098(-)
MRLFMKFWVQSTLGDKVKSLSDLVHQKKNDEQAFENAGNDDQDSVEEGDHELEQDDGDDDDDDENDDVRSEPLKEKKQRTKDSQPKKEKKLSNVEKLTLAMKELKKVPICERALELLWQEATPNDAMSLQTVLSAEPAKAQMFVAMPPQLRAEWIAKNVPKNAESSLSDALKKLFSLNLYEDEKMRATEIFNEEKNIGET